jgi:SAM-dependent methyltransferase
MHHPASSAVAAERPEPVSRVRAPQSGSWYLDPLAAAQKRRVNLEVVGLALEGLEAPPQIVLKTDLFEEANGDDQLLFDLDLGQSAAIGFDLSRGTARKARARSPLRFWPLFSADARSLPLATGSIDLIVSPSTLDHMSRASDIEEALRELYRILRPGGRIALTLDNPWNPVYPLLRALCATPWAPFELGRTLSRRELDRMLRRVGFEPFAWQPIIHNPRVFSTLYFLLLRRVMGERADPWVARAIALFERLDRLPTRSLTCCFHAVCAAKPKS